VTVTVDVVTESNRTDNTNPYTFSHSGGTGPKGVLLIINQNGDDADLIGEASTVSYGGTAMTRVQFAQNGVATPSGGASYIYFLGASVPTGTKTVSCTFATANSRNVQFTCVTLDGADNLEVVDSGISESTGATNPQISLTYSGRTCMAFAGLLAGRGAVSDYTAVASTTALHDNDFGARVGFSQRQTTAGSSDFTVGYTASSGSIAMTACAISETANAVNITGVGAANLGIIYDNELRVEIDGTNFSGSSNSVKLHNTDPLTTTPSTSVTQTIRTESATLITFDVDKGAHSSDDLWLEVKNSGATSSDSIFLAVRDDPGASSVATRTNPSDQEFQSGQAFTFDFSDYFFASDVQDTLSFSMTGAPDDLSISTDGIISGTIADNESSSSPHTVDVTCTDSDGNSVTDQFTWTVNAQGTAGPGGARPTNFMRRCGFTSRLLGRR